MMYQPSFEHETFIVCSKIQQQENKSSYSHHTQVNNSRQSDIFLRLKEIFLKLIRQNFKIKCDAKTTYKQVQNIPPSYNGLRIYLNIKFTKKDSKAYIELSSIYIPHIQSKVDSFLDIYEPRSFYLRGEIIKINEEHLQHLSMVYQSIKAIEKELTLYDTILQQLRFAYEQISNNNQKLMEDVDLNFKQIKRKELDEISKDILQKIVIKDYAQIDLNAQQDRNHKGRLHHKKFLLKRIKFNSIQQIFRQIPEELKNSLNDLYKKCKIKQQFVCSCCQNLQVRNEIVRQQLIQILKLKITAKQMRLNQLRNQQQFTHECAEHFYQYQFMLQLQQYLRMKEEKEHIERMIKRDYLRQFVEYFQPRRQTRMHRDYGIKYRSLILQQIIDELTKTIEQDQCFLSWIRIYQDIKNIFERHYENKQNEFYKIDINFLNNSQDLMRSMKWISVLRNIISQIFSFSKRRTQEQKLLLDQFVDFKMVKEQMLWLRHLSKLRGILDKNTGLLKDEIDCLNPYLSEVNGLFKMCQQVSLVLPYFENSQSSPRLALIILYIYIELKELEKHSFTNQRFAGSIIDILMKNYYSSDKNRQHFRPPQELTKPAQQQSLQNMKQMIGNSLQALSISQRKFKTQEIFQTIKYLHTLQHDNSVQVLFMPLKNQASDDDDDK